VLTGDLGHRRRKRESQRDVNGWKTSPSRLRCWLRLACRTRGLQWAHSLFCPKWRSQIRNVAAKHFIPPEDIPHCDFLQSAVARIRDALVIGRKYNHTAWSNRNKVRGNDCEPDGAERRYAIHRADSLPLAGLKSPWNSQPSWSLPQKLKRR